MSLIRQSNLPTYRPASRLSPIIHGQQRNEMAIFRDLQRGLQMYRVSVCVQGTSRFFDAWRAMSW